MLQRVSFGGFAAFSLAQFSSLDSGKKEIYKFHPGEKRKRAVIIGGGIAGVSTACCLKDRGFEVVLLEQNENDCGEECSKVSAGGMQLLNGVVDSSTYFTTFKQMFTPASPRKFFYIDVFQCATDPLWWRWILNFTLSCFMPNKVQHDDMLELTCEAVNETKNVFKANSKMAEEAGFSESGAIKVLTSEAEAAKMKANPQWTAMSREKTFYANEAELRKLLPWLPRTLGKFGAIVQPECAKGSSEVFTKHMSRNVNVVKGVEVENAILDSSGKNIVELKTNKGNRLGKRLLNLTNCN